MSEPAFLFRTLSDPTRLRLLNLLADGETCVCELTGTLRVVQPKVSRHLARLKRAGLVDARRDGKWMHYRWRGDSDPLVRHVLGGLRAWMAKDDRMNAERQRRQKVCCRVSRRKARQTAIKMKTNEFISALRVAPQNRLIFIDADGHSVPGGYHLTELKSASFDTVDCGGQRNQWQETIVQLWEPPDHADDHMTAAKFLKIFDKVSRMIPLSFKSEIRIEYGDENFFPSTYHVRSVNRHENATRILLEPPATTCKARDRRAIERPWENSCCAATTQSCCAASLFAEKRAARLSARS